jgi:thymidylate synthase (FAD)
MNEDETVNQITRKVLDHGFVRLIDFMGDDLAIVRAARTSYDAAWRAGDDKGSDHHLIRYLWKHKHTSPFEAVTLTFEVKAPIFVFRQWHRHRTWSYNELSGRYRELPAEFYVPDPQRIGVPDPKNRQSRIISGAPVYDNGTCELIHEACQAAFMQYHIMLGRGVPRELARTVLPLATYSHMFASVNLLNLFRFMTLRSDDRAQYEIRVYSDAMKELAKSVAPVAVAAWEAETSGADSGPSRQAQTVTAPITLR